jgi:hypothetical protein
MKIGKGMFLSSLVLGGVLGISLYFDTEGRAILWEENDIGEADLNSNDQVVWSFSSQGNQKLWVKFTPIPSDVPIQVTIKSTDETEIWSSTIEYPMYTTFFNSHSGGTYDVIVKNIGEETVSISGAATDMPDMPDWLSITSNLAFYLILIIPFVFITSIIIMVIERIKSKKIIKNS